MPEIPTTRVTLTPEEQRRRHLDSLVDSLEMQVRDQVLGFQSEDEVYLLAQLVDRLDDRRREVLAERSALLITEQQVAAFANLWLSLDPLTPVHCWTPKPGVVAVQVPSHADPLEGLAEALRKRLAVNLEVDVYYVDDLA